MTMRRLIKLPKIPYPLSAMRISFDVNPFGFWWKPDWVFKRDLTEFAKSQGTTIWWVRWAWFQISYSRWI